MARVDPNFKALLGRITTIRKAQLRAGVVFAGTLLGAREAIAKLGAVNRSVRKRIIRKCVRRACQLAARLSKPYVPVRNKVLSNSIGWRMAKARPGGFTALGVVGARRRFIRFVDGKKQVATKYQHLVDAGTAPHEITGRRTSHGKLAFNAFGRLVVVSRVQHPGTNATNFLRKARQVSRGPCLTVVTSVATTELSIQAAKARPSEVDDG